MLRSVTNKTFLSLSPLTPSWLTSSLINQALLSEGMVGNIYIRLPASGVNRPLKLLLKQTDHHFSITLLIISGNPFILEYLQHFFPLCLQFIIAKTVCPHRQLDLKVKILFLYYHSFFNTWNCDPQKVKKKNWLVLIVLAEKKSDSVSIWGLFSIYLLPTCKP